MSSWVIPGGVILVCKTSNFQTFLEKRKVKPTLDVHHKWKTIKVHNYEFSTVHILFKLNAFKCNKVELSFLSEYALGQELEVRLSFNRI